MHLTKSGKPNPHCGKPHHPVAKFVQSAFHGVEEGMKIYGTLKGAYNVGKTVYSAAQAAAPVVSGAYQTLATAATAAAPYMEAAAAMMV